MKYTAMLMALVLSLGMAGLVHAGGCGGGKDKSNCGKCSHEKGSDDCKKECADKKSGEGC